MTHISGTANGPGVVLDHASPMFLRHLLRTRIPRVRSKLVAIHGVTHVPNRHTGVTIRDCSSHVSPIKTYINIGKDHMRKVMHRLHKRGVSIVGCARGVSLFVAHTLDPTTMGDMRVRRRRHGTRMCLGPSRISLTVKGDKLGVGLTDVLARCAVSMFHRVRNTRSSNRSVCLSRFVNSVSR